MSGRPLVKLLVTGEKPALLRVRDGVPANSSPHRFLRVRISLN
jgi:hypothetical protein